MSRASMEVSRHTVPSRVDRLYGNEPGPDRICASANIRLASVNYILSRKIITPGAVRIILKMAEERVMI